MSYRNWKDTLIGFLFENWAYIDNRLTGKEHVDDSTNVERYAKALGIEATFLGDAVVFSLPDSEIPWENIESWNSDGKSAYLSLTALEDPKFKAILNGLKEKLEATGLTPDAGPAIIHVNEWS
jgi:hypothetical protein